jgi:serine protease
MKNNLKFSTNLLLLSLAMVACGKAVQPPSIQPNFPSESVIENQLIVGFTPNADKTSVAAALGATVERVLPNLNVVLLKLPAGLRPEKASLMLEGMTGVRYSEANRMISMPDPHMDATSAPKALSLQAVASDPDLAKQWQHRQLKTPEVWAKGITGKGIRIGIVDDDMDRTHPDLAPNIVYPGFDGTDGTLVQANTVYDGAAFHGTSVAGTAAAASNGIGGAGVAYGASIVPITHSHGGSNTFSIFDAMSGFIFGVVGPDGFEPGDPKDTDTPAGHNGYVDILNLSGGGNANAQIESEVVQYALAFGIVVVASAGNNSDTGPNFPASLPGVVSAGATTPNGGLTGFTSRSTHVSVAAPGQNVYVTGARFDKANTTTNTYRYIDGTSFSAPATAGVAALMLEASADKNPDGSIKQINLGPRQVRRILEATATGNRGRQPGSGYGVVDAAAAVTMAQDKTKWPAKGAGVILKFVLSSDNTVGIPTSAATLIGSDGIPLYGMAGSGAYIWSPGSTPFFEIEPDLYTVLASGPRPIETGVNAVTSGGLLSLDPEFNGVIALKLAVTPPKDAFEPNDSAAKATAVALGENLSATLPLGDQDWYSLDLKADVPVWIDSTPTSGSANTKISVVNAAGVVLASNSGYTKTGATATTFRPGAALEFKPSADGRYFVKVQSIFSDAGTIFDRYIINFSTAKGAETEPNGSAKIADDKFSEVNTAGANDLGLGNSLTAEINPESDVDFYSFTGKKDDAIMIKTKLSVEASPDTVMTLIGPDGKVIAGNDDADGTASRIDAKLPADGTYLVGVAAFTTATQKSKGTYRISVTKNR